MPLDPPLGLPSAIIDLATEEGARLTQSQWQTRGSTEEAWENISPAALEARRGPGGMSFQWYRTRVTIPEQLGPTPARGTTVVFETVVDDYAEIQVDGRLPVVLGQTGGPLIKGFNAPNRLILTRNARTGQSFEIMIFSANGPLSRPPP